MLSLNPLSAGKSFQTDGAGSNGGNSYVLIPYQQGSPFRQLESEIPLSAISLNPLSAGKSFQTWK